MVVKKYPNRRLYDTESSKYINLEDLAELIRSGEDVQIVDVESGDDLTREVYLQIVLEVLKGREFLPTGMLRRMIRASGGDPVQKMLREHMTRAFDVMSVQMDQIEGLFRAAPRPGRKPDPKPESEPKPDRKAPKASRSAPKAAPQDDDDLGALRARLDELEARLGRKR